MSAEGFGGAGASVRWAEPTPNILYVLREPLPRDPNAPTIGRMVALGLDPILWTLEDAWRNNAVGVSCVPEGTFKLALLPSYRFHREMLRLLSVPDRTAILIHAGNTDADTEGCILVGREIAPDRRSLLRSREALALVLDWWRRTAPDGPVFCRISRAAAPAAPAGLLPSPPLPPAGRPPAS